MDRGRLAPLAALSGLPEEELDAVAQVASERDFAPGETLTHEGDFGHCMFLIEDGSADVYVDGDKVGETTTGQIVGEVAVLASGRRTASVVANSPVKAISFFKRDIWRLENKAPEATGRLRAAMKEHVERPPSA
jgi:CRP-like cAMP-binding protein